MEIRKVLKSLTAVGAGAAAFAYSRYRREMDEICAKIESGSTLADTIVGPIEYADEGVGEALLMIHGAGGGYDQGLMIGRDFANAFRIIAPSRFGYLRTPAPADCSPTAQANAHAALLDAIGVDKCIVAGASAGAPSAIEFALRYPERTRALILLVPRTYDPSDSIRVDEGAQAQAILRLVEASADFFFWVAMRLARPAMLRFLGVRPEIDASAPEVERARVSEVMRSILPLSRRVRGIAVDSTTVLAPWPLEKIKAPTLIITAEDDLFETLPGAQFTAAGIRGAELRVLNSGGHLMVGKGKQVQQWVSEFLERRASSAHGSRAPRKAPGKPVPAFA